MRENRVNKWFWIILAGWLFLIGGSFAWNSQHGGLYVPVTAETPPIDMVVMDLTIPGGMGGKNCQ